MERTVERATVSAARGREYRSDGQGRVQRAKRAGARDAERDGQGHGRAGRLPGGFVGRAACGRLRVSIGHQGIPLHDEDEPYVTYTLTFIFLKVL